MTYGSSLALLSVLGSIALFVFLLEKVDPFFGALMAAAGFWSRHSGKITILLGVAVFSAWGLVLLR